MPDGVSRVFDTPAREPVDRVRVDVATTRVRLPADVSMSMELAVTRVAVTLWVPRGAAGDLAGGARAVLEDVQVVDRIETLDVAGFRPTATDIRVDLDARVVLVADADAAAIVEGFGVLDAEVNA